MIYSRDTLLETNTDWEIRPIFRLMMKHANVIACVRVAFNTFEMDFQL